MRQRLAVRVGKSLHPHGQGRRAFGLNRNNRLPGDVEQHDRAGRADAVQGEDIEKHGIRHAVAVAIIAGVADPDIKRWTAKAGRRLEQGRIVLDQHGGRAQTLHIQHFHRQGDVGTGRAGDEGAAGRAYDGRLDGRDLPRPNEDRRSKRNQQRAAWPLAQKFRSGRSKRRHETSSDVLRRSSNQLPRFWPRRVEKENARQIARRLQSILSILS